MTFDLVTVSFATAVVVTVAGVVFLLETLLHAPSDTTRLWSVSFLSGILTTFCYLVWALGQPGAWVATAVGNTSFTLSAGFLWLGCRRFNGHGVHLPVTIVGAVSLAAGAAALLAGPDGGDWAGAAVMFAGIAVFSTLGAIESRRGVMGAQTVALTVTAVLVLTAVYYIARTAVFLVLGPESRVFLTWFGTVTTSFLTITLTITALAGFSVLRATESTLRGRGQAATLGVSADGLLDPSSFETVLQRGLERAEREKAGVAVVALRLDDLPEIATAFGTQEAATIVTTWRTAVADGSPLGAVVGEEGPYGVMVAMQLASLTEARSVATKLQQRVIRAMTDAEAAVIPVVGVGLATTDLVGYDAAALIDSSNDAARRSAAAADAAVVVAS